MLYLDNTERPWREKYNSPACVVQRTLIKDAFKGLVFDEGPHTYTLNGQNIPSVSSMVEKFVVPFDSERISKFCAEKHFNDESSEYYHMTAAQIKKSWADNAKAATDRGTIAHAFGESCMHYMVGDYDGILPEYRDRLLPDGRFYSNGGFEDAIVKFWLAVPDSYVPILAETQVYTEAKDGTILYAGTFDLLFYTEINGKRGTVMFDWKTNADLYKNFNNKKMIRGLEYLLDNPKNHYEVQQTLYEKALRDKGVKVFGKRLIWIKESGEYEVVKLKELIMERVIHEIEVDAGISNIDF